MKTHPAFAFLCVPVMLGLMCAAGIARPANGAVPATSRILSADPVVAAAAVAELRQAGPPGLAAVLRTYDSEIQLALRGRSDEVPNWPEIRAAVGAVAAQRDAHISRLYWHTDIERAKSESSKTGKPILALRLLGRLDEELSCANSRFFRTVLYSNSEVSRYLGENYVLVWQTERPAPVITIDFGDGRKMVRTITGNSIHYVLDATGTPIDALPGLYGPTVFLRELMKAHELHAALRAAPAAKQSEIIATYHQAGMMESQAAWDAANAELQPKPIALDRGGDGGSKTPATTRPSAADRVKPPAASTAAPLAITKSRVEVPMLRAMDLWEPASERGADDPIWSRISSRSPWDYRLSGASLDLVRQQLATTPAQRTGRDAAFEARLGEIARDFELRVKLDTVRNEFVLRPAIREVFVSRGGQISLRDLNAWIYDGVFLTPASDPWLGLHDSDVYTGLDLQGLVEP